jgi:YVTN family beta-propeller protein
MARTLGRGALALSVGITLTLATASLATAAAPVTPAGWRVHPIGTEIAVPQGQPGMQGPSGSALSPDGSQLLVDSSGAAQTESVDLFDLNAGARTSFLPFDAATGQSVFYGVAWSPDGTKAWASGGGQQVVHALSVSGGSVTETATIPTATPCTSHTGDGACFPAGIAYGQTPIGPRLYVADNLSGPAGGAAGNPAGSKVTVIDPATNSVTGTIDLGEHLQPVGVAFDRTGRRAFVSNWMGRSVSVIDTTGETEEGDVQLSPLSNPAQADHPVAIAANPVRDEMYTANASSDTVSVIDSANPHLIDTIDVRLVHGPLGAIPDGLAVSPDGGTLYVAEAGENAVAVVDLRSRKVKGFIPTAWYPTAVSALPDGQHLAIVNTNASGSGPNPCNGLSPVTNCPDPSRDRQYPGSNIKGDVQLVQIPSDQQLGKLTKSVLKSNQAKARGRKKPRALDQIKHVIYVIKENRTYDQVYGDLPKGNGDPSLDLFKDDSAPNQRALAQRFALFDNFYADAEVSADGHNWITQAGATDYVDKTYPINYSPSSRSGERSYDFEDVPLGQQFSSEPLLGYPSIPRSPAAQTGGYLWDDAYAHGVSFRDYGEYASFGTGGTCSNPLATSDTTHLAAAYGDHLSHAYTPYTTSCSDHVDREPVWEKEFHGYEKSGKLPALEVVRLGNDHTNGTRAGSATPQSYVADNDLAVGRLVDAVSHSKYWKSTAILMTEDDAQNGPDHVDAHRTTALVVSPYTQHGRVDSTQYDTAAMVATIEGLLGMPPMTVTDARAARMWKAFGSTPRLNAYNAIQPSVVPFGDPGFPVNGASAPMAAAAATWDLKDADAAPEIALNQSIWKSVHGRRSKMPKPRHRRIIGSQPNDGGDQRTAASGDGDDDG